MMEDSENRAIINNSLHLHKFLAKFCDHHYNLRVRTRKTIRNS
ncbi:hypothetical protein [Treponema sp.]|nr:hypothetical protein [Treponema sp.]